MEKNRKQYKGKKRLKFRHIYALIMLLVTLGLAWHVLDLLVFTPMRETSVFAQGVRMDDIQELEQPWKDATEAFGVTLDSVEHVSVFWNTGPVVYVNIRVDAETSLRDAKRAAREIIEYFIAASHEVALQYDIQVVLSNGDVGEAQIDETREAVTRHVQEHHHDLIQRILVHAEHYPSASNVGRASDNIEIFAESIIAVAGEEGIAEMRARVRAIDVVDDTEVDDTEEGEEAPTPKPRYAGGLQIPPSSISDFPTWGTWNNENERIIWNRN